MLQQRQQESTSIEEQSAGQLARSELRQLLDLVKTVGKFASSRSAQEDRPTRVPFLSWSETSMPHGRAGEKGFSIAEMLIAVGILTIVMAVFVTVLVQMGQVTEREGTRSVVISNARSGIEFVTRYLRNDMIQFNTVPGTPLGVNFDLDSGGGPLVRDALLFYIDQNRTAQLYVADETGEPFTAGLDDGDGDGFADVLGIGLLRQDENGDGVQDFIDVDLNGVADDFDGDGNADPLWHLVAVRFNSINDVGNAAFWQAGRMLARNLYVHRLVPGGPLNGANIDTFQFMAKSPTALLADGDGNGVLDEQEIGSLVSADGIINAPLEVATIDAVIVTSYVVDLAQFGGRRSFEQEQLSTQIMPRAFALFRRNGIVDLADPTDPKHIN